MPSIEQTKQMISKLVGFNTVSKESNLNLIDFVAEYLKSYKIKANLISDQNNRKANLYASVGPNVEGGIILSGHTDVVPIDGQLWNSDPFQLTEKNKLLFGRGTCDMKSFIAIGLTLIPDMLVAKIKKPIHFALSYDEEIGCAGAPSMIAELLNSIGKPSAVFVGEPTNMKIISAHKSIQVYKTTVIGKSAHSSLTDKGVSAVMTAAKLIEFLNQLAEENIRGTNPQSNFNPPYTTVHVGMIRGGTAVNIISERCEFFWDLRCIPSENPRDYKKRFDDFANQLKTMMQKFYPLADILTKEIASAPPFQEPEGSEAEKICKKITSETTVGAVSYATEAGLYRSAGYSTIVCGPGSIDQAHKPDEYISVDQVAKGINFINGLIKEFSD